MRVLSLTATCRLAERITRKACEPVAVDDLVKRIEQCDVDPERAEAGIRLSVTVGRLIALTDNQGRPCVAHPTHLSHQETP